MGRHDLAGADDAALRGLGEHERAAERRHDRPQRPGQPGQVRVRRGGRRPLRPQPLRQRRPRLRDLRHGLRREPHLPERADGPDEGLRGPGPGRRLELRDADDLDADERQLDEPRRHGDCGRLRDADRQQPDRQRLLPALQRRELPEPRRRGEWLGSARLERQGDLQRCLLHPDPAGHVLLGGQLRRRRQQQPRLRLRRPERGDRRQRPVVVGEEDGGPGVGGCG